MSEYQYYEFCKISAPITKATRELMNSLSSRAKVGTHNACYVYNYGDFRGNSKEILLNYFDVYFYISNFGVMELFFKYKNEDIDVEAISKNCSKDVINLVKYGQYSILKIRINKEEGCGWIEGDGLLADLLSLYDEIKNKSYQSLELISAIDYDLNNEGEYLSAFIKDKELTEGQQALVDCMKLFSY